MINFSGHPLVDRGGGGGGRAGFNFDYTFRISLCIMIYKVN